MVPLLPENERQTRPLAKLPPPLQIKAWEKAVETAIALIIVSKFKFIDIYCIFDKIEYNI